MNTNNNDMSINYNLKRLNKGMYIIVIFPPHYSAAIPGHDPPPVYYIQNARVIVSGLYVRIIPGALYIIRFCYAILRAGVKRPRIL